MRGWSGSSRRALRDELFFDRTLDAIKGFRNKYRLYTRVIGASGGKGKRKRLRMTLIPGRDMRRRRCGILTVTGEEEKVRRELRRRLEIPIT